MNTIFSILRPRLASLLLVLATLFPQLVLAQTATQPTQGDGSADNPYQIESLEHLMWFRDQVNAGERSLCAVLTQDIDMAGQNWTPIGKYNASYRYSYNGTFNGQGHTLYNLTINASQNGVGLFSTAYLATIQNIVFENPVVKNTPNSNDRPPKGAYIAVVVGVAINTTIKGIQINNGSVIAEYVEKTSVYGGSEVGSIAGAIKNSSKIISCTNYATVSGYSACGGIAGTAEQSTIENCSNHGDIIAQTMVGGIVYKYDEATFNNLLNTGNMTTLEASTGGNTAKVGLLIGSPSTIRSTKKTTIDGILAYSTAILVNGKSYSTPVCDEKNLYAPDGTKNFDDIIQAVTPEQLQSGEVAWRLNGETAEAPVWHQLLGTDAWPAPFTKEGGIVYHGTLCGTETDRYANDAKEFDAQGVKHVAAMGYDTTGLYGLSCTGCRKAMSNERWIKDFCGEAGRDLPLIAQPDGTYTALESVSIADATTYNSPVDFQTEELTYSRSFTSNAWQPLYLPFPLPTAELPEGYEVAVLNNFHEYQTDKGYAAELEVRRVVDGSIIPALTPCLLRCNADEVKDLELPLTDAALTAAANRSVSCRSVTRSYTFTGTLEGKTDFDPNHHFVMKGGHLYRAAAAAQLRPQRWYLTATDRTGSTTSMPARITVKVADDDATAIGELQVITDPAAPASAPAVIYDLQGRRLQQEPQHGVYIKNGKKYVK